MPESSEKPITRKFVALTDQIQKWDGSVKAEEYPNMYQATPAEWLNGSLLQEGDVLCGVEIKLGGGAISYSKIDFYIYEGKNEQSFDQALHGDTPITLKKISQDIHSDRIGTFLQKFHECSILFAKDGLHGKLIDYALKD